jgi:hypothetical protein
MPSEVPPAARDAALRRASRLKRWIAAGAIGLAGVFSAVAAHAFPGRSVQDATATGTGESSSSSDSTGLPSTEDDSAGGRVIQPPASPPQPSSDSSGGAVSGGS